MLSNIFFALFGPSLTDGLKSLQFIQELSHVVLQLVHNIVGSELRESRCERLKDNTNFEYTHQWWPHVSLPRASG